MAGISMISRAIQRIYNENDERYRKKLFHELKTNPGSRLSVLKRYANIIKDPNPVSSTMSIISTPYPFLMHIKGLQDLTQEEQEKFVYVRSRRENATITKSIIRDTRYENQVRVKKEIFNYWLQKKMEMETPIMDTAVIDLMYKPLRRDVENYYSINHNKLYIKFKINMQDSSRVNLRPLSMFNNFDAYDSVLTKMLEPNEITPKQEIDYMLVYDKLKSEEMLNLFKTLGIMDQARIIENLTSPLFRTVPTFRDLPSQMVNVGTSFEGPNWWINVDFQLERFIRDDDSYLDNITNLIRRACTNFFNIVVNSKFNDSLPEMRRLFRTILVERKQEFGKSTVYIPLHTFINKDTTEYNEKIQFVKLLMGYSITMKTIIGKTHIFTVKGQPKTKRTANNHYVIRDGKYSIGFIRDSLRGYLKIKNGYISDMLFNWTSTNEFMELLEDLGEYLGVGADVLDQEKKVYESLVKAIRRGVRDRPGSIFENTTDEDVRAMISTVKSDHEKTSDINFSVPMANYSTSVEVQPPNPLNYDFEVTKFEVRILEPRMRDGRERSVINVIMNKERVLGRFDPQINTVEIDLYHFLDWKLGLRKTLIELVKNVEKYLLIPTIDLANKFSNLGSLCQFDSIRNTCRYVAENMRQSVLVRKKQIKRRKMIGNYKKKEEQYVKINFHPVTWAICTIFSSTLKTYGNDMNLERIPVMDETIYLKYNQGLVTHSGPQTGTKRKRGESALAGFSFDGETINWKENVMLIQFEKESQLMMQVVDQELVDWTEPILSNINEVKILLGRGRPLVYYDDAKRLYKCFYDTTKSLRQSSTISRVVEGSSLRESTIGTNI